MRNTLQYRGSRALRLCALLAILAGPIHSETINEVVVRKRGDVPVEETHVRAYISSTTGDELAPEAVARDVRALLDTGHYAFVTTTLEPAGDGLRLVFTVEGRYSLVEPVEVRGNSALGKAKVRELMELSPGDMVDSQVVAAAVAKVREDYRKRASLFRKRRFFGAEVEGELLPMVDSPGNARVRVTVTEGDRTRVPLIRFSGNKAVKDSRLRRYSGQSPWWNPSGWFSEKRLDEYDLELLRADVRRQYADIGYLDAEVSEPEIKEKDGKRLIAYEIKEGRQYRLGPLEVEGNDLFPASALLRASGLQPGEVANHSAIQRSASAIRDFYGERGYVDTLVTVSLLPDPGRPGLVGVRYKVSEGEMLHVRNILIRGNTKTKDKVIRREIPLNPGDLLDEVEAERSERRLLNLGYFETVRHHDLALVGDDRRDLVFDVEEKPTGQFLVGAGFSSIDKIIGYLELSQSNFDLFNWGRFTGGGQKVRLGISGSRYNTDVELSFVEPWLFDRRLQLNLDAFSRSRNYNEYDERRLGGSVGLSRHVPWIGRMGLSYTLQHVRLSDIIEGDYAMIDSPEEIYRFTDEDSSYLEGSMRLNWTYDTRDRPMLPRRGTRATASGTLYGEALGGDHDMYELNARAWHYIPTFYGHVISFHVRSDVIDAIGGDEVPIGNRYFLGGGRNVRGFRYRAVGPKARPADESRDMQLYRPVGGQTLLNAFVEYTIPITSFFRIAAFYDIGNVWADSFDYDLSEYASSFGGGIRLDFPGFPLRFDYAIPIKEDDEFSRKRRWVFWVGFD